MQLVGRAVSMARELSKMQGSLPLVVSPPAAPCVLGLRGGLCSAACGVPACYAACAWRSSLRCMRPAACSC